MGRPPCCDKSNVKRGLWTPEEDKKILAYVSTHGAGNWASVPKKAGLRRCGKSCRLRWTNYLRPDLKHDDFTPQEEQMIVTIHSQIGSRWSLIAQQLPGRTDNDVKNYWNTKLKKKLIERGIDPVTHKPISHVVNSIQGLSRGSSSNINSSTTADAGGRSGSPAGAHKRKDPRVSCLSRELRNVFMASMREPPVLGDHHPAAADIAETSAAMQQAVAFDCEPSWDLLAQLHAVKLVADASQVTMASTPPPDFTHNQPPSGHSPSSFGATAAPPQQEAVAPPPPGPCALSRNDLILHGESRATSYGAGTSSKPMPGGVSGESSTLQGCKIAAGAGGRERSGGAVLQEGSGTAGSSSYVTGEDVMCTALEEAPVAAPAAASDIDSFVESLLNRDEQMMWEFPEFLEDPFGCP